MMSEQDDFEKLLEKLTASTHAPRGRYSAPESWELLEKRITPPRRKSTRRRIATVATSVAASVLLCLAGWYTYDYLRPASILTVSAQAEVMTVTLPEGTTVTLNRYSTLQYPDRFKGSRREVQLEGEAYFEVQKDKHHPFIVNAEEMRIQVLGTHFNVEAYPGDEQIRTTLLEGSVSVSSPGEELLLSPHESAVYDRKGQTLKHEITPESGNEIAWRDGIFLFDNLPLREIARQLSHAFGVKIDIATAELADYHIRARFTDKESLGQILDLLQGAGNFTYKKTNGNISIIAKQE